MTPFYSNFPVEPIPPEHDRRGYGMGDHPYRPSRLESSEAHSPRSYRLPHEPYREPLDSGIQLQGPGMPGSTPSQGRYRHFRDQDLPVAQPHDSSRQSLRTPLGSHLHPDTSPSYHHPSTRTRQSRTSSTTLPPLMLDARSRRGSFSAPGPSVGHSIGSHSDPRSHFDVPQQDTHPGPQFAYQIPEQSGHSSAVILPPPFTLQPRPQWDESAYSAIPTHRPTSSWDPRSSFRTGGGQGGSSSSVRPTSSSRRNAVEGTSVQMDRRRVSDWTSGDTRHQPSSSFVMEADSSRGDREERDPYHVMEPSPPRRLRRFDPVRSMFVSVDPPSGPSQSPSMPSQDFSPMDTVRGRSPSPP
jgi:hypothetical protein